MGRGKGRAKCFPDRALCDGGSCLDGAAVSRVVQARPDIAVTAHRRAQTIALGPRNERCPQPGSADGIAFRHHHLSPGIVTGERKREGEADEQAKQGEHRRKQVAIAAFTTIDLAPQTPEPHAEVTEEGHQQEEGNAQHRERGSRHDILQHRHLHPSHAEAQ